MNGPKFTYACAVENCARICRFKRAKIKGASDNGKPVFTEGLGKPNCPQHGPTKARRESVKAAA